MKKSYLVSSYTFEPLYIHTHVEVEKKNICLLLHIMHKILAHNAHMLHIRDFVIVVVD